LRDMRTDLANSQTSGKPTVPDAILPDIRRNSIYNTTECYAASITTSTTLESFVPIAPTLSNIGNSAQYVGLFDSYRIVGVRVRFLQASPVINTTTGQNFPNIYTAIDYNDSNSVSAISIMQYDTYKPSSTIAYFERSFVPRVALSAYSGATASASATKGGQWLSTAFATVTHYGLKIVVEANPSVAVLRAIVELRMQFRNTT